MRTNKLFAYICFATLLCITFGFSYKATTTKPKPKKVTTEATKQPMNVLFIAVDDLRPELSCYGQSMIKSPNIDKLASQGTLFENAYCNVPVCGASRASLLTGLRPLRDRFVDYDARIDKAAPKAKTIASHFQKNGYTTLSIGKISHFPDDRKEDYSKDPWRPDYHSGASNWRNYNSEENLKIADEQPNGAGLPYDAADVPDNEYFDGMTAERAISELKQLKSSGKPFYMGLGFLKPHLPFTAPQKYWDLYEEDKVNLPYNYFKPEDAPNAAMHSFGELRSYYGIPESGPVSDEMAKKLIHGYYACVSYTDAQIGKVLTALDEMGLAENTVVVLWGDHGWQLGEHALWCKHSNFKTSLKVPLMVRAPGKKAGQRASGMVELMDLFPTLCELTGTKTPKKLHGQSFVPLLDNPNGKGKDQIFCQWKHGATILTDQFAYTEYSNDSGNVYGKMLYDHKKDPDENKNVIDYSEYGDVVSDLSERLHNRPQK